MSYYECVFIVRQDVSSGQVDQLVEDYTKIIEMQKASVQVKAMAFFNRALAYSSTNDYDIIFFILIRHSA